MIKEAILATLVALAPANTNIIPGKASKTLNWMNPPTNEFRLYDDYETNYDVAYRDHESVLSTGAIIGDTDASYQDFGPIRVKQKCLERQYLDPVNQTLQIDLSLVIDIQLVAETLETAVITVYGNAINQFVGLEAVSWDIYEKDYQSAPQDGWYTNWYRARIGTGQGNINIHSKYDNAYTALHGVSEDSSWTVINTASSADDVNEIRIQTHDGLGLSYNKKIIIVNYSFYVGVSELAEETYQLPIYQYDNLWQQTSIYMEYTVEAVYQEVVDIPGLMFTILGMPFAWISQAFNFTIFPGTPYAVNISHVFLTVIVALILIVVIKKIVR